MKIQERQHHAIVVQGCVIQEFDPTTRTFVKQYFVPECAAARYEAPDGGVVGPDVFLNEAGDEYKLSLDMVQPVKPKATVIEVGPIADVQIISIKPVADVQVLNLGHEMVVHAHKNGELTSTGILGDSAAIEKNPDPTDKKRAEEYNAAVGCLLDFVSMLAQHGMDLSQSPIKAAMVKTLHQTAKLYK